jgi:hypothetical protein
MLNIGSTSGDPKDTVMIHRRDAMIRLGAIGLGSLTLPDLLKMEGTAQAQTIGGRKAKSCIFLFLWGGPPGQDLWDLKPDAPEGIRSPFRPIATTVPGISFCDQLPRLAAHADKIAVVRSMTHQCAEHSRSVHHALSGRPLGTNRIFPSNDRRRVDFPFVGSVVSAFSPPGPMPTSLCLPGPVAHDGVVYAGTHAGFLGPRHDPMELGDLRRRATGAPVDNPWELSSPAHLPDGVDAARMTSRQSLLQRLEAESDRLQRAGASEGLGGLREQAFRMVSSPAAKRSFDLGQEDPRLRDRYGRNEYGEGFLLARRLVETGVRLVAVNWMFVNPVGKVFNVWDTHGGIGGLEGGATGYGMLAQDYCIPSLDRALSALLDDLAQRGMLDETLVVAVGEFGRMPRINGFQGREHWPFCYSALLAGGGIRGGQTYGASDKHAAYVKDNPVAPEDLLATIYHALGLPLGAQVHDLEGRPFPMTEGTPLAGLFG